MLFPSLKPPLPPGFRYIEEWLTATEEETLLRHVEALSFVPIRMRGVTAKRQVVHFGWDYGYESWRITPASPIPDWLMDLRARSADLIEVPVDAMEEALVTRYEPGAGIGWHRDAPMFGPTVVGVSLKGACRMRFQRNAGARRETAECRLERRSVYVLSDEARSAWQHAIPPTKELRYSVTFRTVRRKNAVPER